jgi:hypothetical protein
MATTQSTDNMRVPDESRSKALPDHDLHKKVVVLQNELNQSAQKEQIIQSILPPDSPEDLGLASQYATFVKGWNERIGEQKVAYQQCLETEAVQSGSKPASTCLKDSYDILAQRADSLAEALQKLGTN